MRRRDVVAALLALAAAPAFAHTPYRQWKVMRERFLLVHSMRTDADSDRIAEHLVETLQRVLPKANAMVARARDEQRVASLLTTGQAMLAVMRPDDARELYLRAGRFSGYNGSGVRALVSVDDHLLVTVERFAQHHAWLVASALIENAEGMAISVPVSVDYLPPVHPGAAAFARGEPLETSS